MATSVIAVIETADNFEINPLINLLQFSLDRTCILILVHNNTLVKLVIQSISEHMFTGKNFVVDKMRIPGMSSTFPVLIFLVFTLDVRKILSALLPQDRRMFVSLVATSGICPRRMSLELSGKDEPEDLELLGLDFLQVS